MQTATAATVAAKTYACPARNGSLSCEKIEDHAGMHAAYAFSLATLAHNEHRWTNPLEEPLTIPRPDLAL